PSRVCSGAPWVRQPVRSFAKVYHAQFKRTGANFAIKVMDQEFIKRHKKVPFVVMERQVMSKLSHPNIVKFYCSFKVDPLYMVMELCRGGELLHFIWYSNVNLCMSSTCIR
uniref:non-specific serine/threonine protein kinase n=1 Tax=Hucho hucho TaxID=62062 RepID=A0A4W5LW51_9TELE